MATEQLLVMSDSPELVLYQIWKCWCLTAEEVERVLLEGLARICYYISSKLKTRLYLLTKYSNQGWGSNTGECS